MKERIRWKPGSSYKGVKAVDVHEKIEELRAQNNGICTPADVVAEARNKKSVLHNAGFTWDVNQAAQERWEDQARRLIRSVEIVRTDDEGRKSALPVYVSIGNPYTKGPAYASCEEAMADPVSRDVIVTLARSQLDGWIRRFGKLNEFAKVVAAAQALPQQQVA